MMKNRQSGLIIESWMWMAGAIAILALLGGMLAGVTHYLNGVRAEAKKAGQDECDAAYKLRDNAALTKALSRVQTLEEAARKAEAGHVAALAKIGDQLTKEKDRAKNAQLRVLDDIAAGKLRVRADAFSGTGCPAVSGGGQVGPAVGPAPGDNAAPACQLSAATAGRVLSIGGDADDTARQLASAQQVIVEFLRICGPGT